MWHSFSEFHSPLRWMTSVHRSPPTSPTMRCPTCTSKRWTRDRSSSSALAFDAARPTRFSRWLTSPNSQSPIWPRYLLTHRETMEVDQTISLTRNDRLDVEENIAITNQQRREKEARCLTLRRPCSPYPCAISRPFVAPSINMVSSGLSPLKALRRS